MCLSPKRKSIVLMLTVATAVAITVQSGAIAQRYRDFHGRDFRRFSLEERRIWTLGRWIHDYHDGRLGWWWVVDGVWYFYPQPIYPYPVYIPEPETVVAAPPPAAIAPAPPPGPAPAAIWYYCDNPQGYYPYVQSCGSGWRSVPATPPGFQWQQGDQPPPPPSR